MPDREGVELLTLVIIAAVMAVTGATVKLVWTWENPSRVVRSIGNLGASLFCAAIVGFLSWEILGWRRPGLFAVGCGLGAWLGGDMVDLFGRVFRRRLLVALRVLTSKDQGGHTEE